MALGILFDQNLCIGCGACEVGCQEEHGFKVHKADKLDENNFTYLEEINSITFQRHLCMHCFNPACASACPVSALKKTKEGAVIYNPAICLGCRYCIYACPFNIPKYEWKSPIPRVRKCDFCYSTKISKGLPPACASACPTGATLFGEREELLKTAHQKIKKEPKKYVSEVFGEKEAGGTSVLFLRLNEVTKTNLVRNIPDFALPDLPQKILGKTPLVIVALGLFLGGMRFLTDRKNKIREEEQKKDEE